MIYFNIIAFTLDFLYDLCKIESNITGGVHMNLTSEPTCLGLSEISHAIVESLRSPLEDKIPDMMQDYGLTERLGHGSIPLELHYHAA